MGQMHRAAIDLLVRQPFAIFINSMVAFPHPLDDEMPDGLQSMLSDIAGQSAGAFEKPGFSPVLNEDDCEEIAEQPEMVPVYFLNFVAHERMLRTFANN